MRLKRLKRLLQFDSNMKEVIHLASTGFTVRIFGLLLGFGLSVLVGRTLGAEGAGLYFFALSVVSIASIFGRLGLGNVLVRYISESATRQDWGKGEFVYSAGIRIVCVVSGIIGLAILVSAPWTAVGVFNKPEYKIPLMLAGIAVIPYALLWVEGDALRALREIPKAQICKSVIIPLGTLIVFYPFVRLWGSNGAIVAFVVATVGGVIVGHRLWVRAWRNVAGSYGHSQDSLTVRSLMASSWALMGVALATMGVQNIANILLGAFSSNVDVSTFSVANRVAGLLLLPLNGAIAILAPKFVQLNTMGDMKSLAAVVRKSSWLISLLVAPAVIVIFILAGPVISIYGPNFSSAVPILRILLIGTFVNAATGPSGTLLLMSGKERIVWKLSLVTLALGVGLCVAGVLFYGVTGLAAGIVLSVSIQNIVLVLLVKRHMGFWPIGVLTSSRQ
ncbi:MAG: flippase [Terriglobia bacterium]